MKKLVGILLICLGVFICFGWVAFVDGWPAVGKLLILGGMILGICATIFGPIIVGIALIKK